MRPLLPTLWMVLACGAAPAADLGTSSDIAAVLQRSQDQQLDAMALADASSPGARKVRESFDRLLSAMDMAPNAVDLRVVDGDIVGETLRGQVIVANVALGGRPEGERMFILAHELGHVVLGHWAQMNALYLHWVPGEVVQQNTDPVEGALGRDASALAWRQEFEADAFGLRAVRKLGLPDQDVMGAFMNFGARYDTVTHPGTQRRIAALRYIQPDWLHAGAPNVTRPR